MFPLRIICAAFLGLASCGQLQPVPAEAVPIQGFFVDYEAVETINLGGDPNEHVAAAFWDGRIRLCRIQISEDALTHGPELVTLYLAHEFGHCVDRASLGYSNNGFANEGCAYGPYFCKPSEGYAETYARAYLRKCGPLLAPLGVPDINDGTCELPAPTSIKPSHVSSYLQGE